MSPEHPTPLEADHTPAAIAARIAADPRQAYLRDFIYGSIDGLVTTFAVVTGALGAGLPGGIVVVLGFVNLIADGFSMAVSNYLGTKADRQMVDKARQVEESHVDEIPDGEAAEVREIFRRKGFKGDLLDHIVEVITSDRQLWIETMLREEWGLALHGPSPRKAAFVTFGAFVVIGLIPVLPFLTFAEPANWSFVVSTTLTVAAFFAVGTLKSLATPSRWYRAGAETLLMGGAAALLAWFVGVALRGFVQT